MLETPKFFVLIIASCLIYPLFGFDSPNSLPSSSSSKIASCFSRREITDQCLKNIFGATAASIFIDMAASVKPVVAAPLTAAEKRLPISSRPAARFNNTYIDMLHPGCERRIVVEPVSMKTGNSERSFMATFSGTDVGPDGLGPLVKLACTDETIEKYKLRSWTFEGWVNAAGSDIDAGDGIHVGRWHLPTEEQSWSGIRWADGNRWIVKYEPTNDEYID